MKHKENQLLGALDNDVRQRLARAMSPVDLKLGHVVCEAGGTLEHAYFPQGAVLSLLTVMEDGSAIETANIGREGAFGIFAAMYTRISFNRSVVQLAGPIIRCSISALEQEFSNSSKVQNLFVSYSETLLSQTQQTVGCNTLHTVEERMCRWLLMMDDRVEGEVMAYTQQFLSELMGANRTTVSLAAQGMQDKGLIAYRRGNMQVKDRAGMEKASCECYAIVRRRFDSFLNPPAHAAKKLDNGRNTTL
ncbi:crp-like helix-turn-helix domain protein [Hydrogenophaga sp. RAC07]|uniref:Crp/Fnr family transcriptional regulator n=1 Tax=Hydrogenophaga sp. RAC07 TaxID=1842537 RepID=UPI00083D911C|nr:Crp/Fnr family transcriptional regulator [Hydrogenophaga sp. RAC07]AOF87111.1 crp-like helix-turn-helix domain protein [Hydrogenophaga sp. RAC07]